MSTYVDVKGGNGFPLRFQEKDSDIAFLKVSDLGERDGQKSLVKAHYFISKKSNEVLKAKIYPAKSIIFAKIGAAVFLERKRILSFNACIDNNLAVVLPGSNIDVDFLYYLLANYNISDHVTATALPSINIKDFLSSTHRFPEIPEQQAIAKALSEIDELIEVTEQLLKKKERIFEGALQTEFSKSSGATLTKVSDICEVAKGSAVAYDPDFIHGSFGFLNGGVNFSGLTQKANDSGDTVVISEGGNSCGFVNYMPKPFWCGGHAYRLLGFYGKQKYLYFALKKSEREIMNLRVGSGLPNVQKKDLSEFKTPIHRDPKKQEDVVNFLDLLGGEIDILKREVAKYEYIKHGMAHDLLTRKVRLV